MKIDEQYFFEGNIIRRNTFENEVIIIDGQARSGKNLIAVLLSSMNRVEKMRLDSQVDYIPRYYFLGKMSLDAAIVALKIEFDEKYYYNEIGRDVNFRLSDYSGVMKQAERLKYFRRLFQKADDEAIRRLSINNPIFQEMTHDGLHVANLYFRALEERLKIIHIFRDPVNNIFEQNARYFGERFGVDPREFQLTHDWKNEQIPIMLIGREAEYVNAKPLERLVIIVESMFRQNLKGYQDLSRNDRKRVQFIEFEDFLMHPKENMDRIEKFIGEKFKRSSKRILKRENCPRIIDPNQRLKRIEEIKRNVDSHYSAILDKLIIDYDKRPWKKWGYIE